MEKKKLINAIWAQNLTKKVWQIITIYVFRLCVAGVLLCKNRFFSLCKMEFGKLTKQANDVSSHCFHTRLWIHLLETDSFQVSLYCNTEQQFYLIPFTRHQHEPCLQGCHASQNSGGAQLGGGHGGRSPEKENNNDPLFL